MQSGYTQMLACMPLTVAGSKSHALPSTAVFRVVGAARSEFITVAHPSW